MRRFDQINVIPFIDIMLVLLAIVLTTATFIAQGHIPVNLPGAASADTAEPGPATVVTVAATGELYVDDRAVTLSELHAALEGLERRTRVELKVDAEAPFRHFIAVIDILKAEGLERVAVVTRASP